MAAETAAIEEPTAVQESAAPAPAAKAEKAEKGKGKGAKPKKGKGAGKGEDAAADGGGPSLAAHPRAVRGVARAKSWGALVGFVLGGYLALPTMTLAEAGARALIAGIVCYLAAWAGAVFIWRRVVMLELKSREQELRSCALGRALAWAAQRVIPG